MLEPGTRIGPYTIQESLGKGAQARVYRAIDDRGRPFAVKVRRRVQDAMDRRFLREFESMRLLRLPGVVHVHQAGIEDEYLWFSMDIVHGRPFLLVLLAEADLRRRTQLVIERGRELLGVLARLHEAGFVHRDVKPSNVLITDDGQVRVLDFGIGRYFSSTDTLSQSGEILGTVPYMAPEQLAGLPINAKVDVFAAATMLWECINGKRPRPLTTIGWIPRICLERLEPLAVRHREIPLGLSHLIERMLAVDPVDRPDARESERMFERLMDGKAPPEWPTPRFVDPGEWWTALEAALGRAGKSPVWIVEGDSGSGRSRISEQLHRTGLMSGIWPIHLDCRVDAVGGPLEQFLRRITNSLDESSLARVIGNQGAMLRRMWPHLTLDIGEGVDPPSTGEVAAALTQVVRRCADHQPLVLIVHDLERIDTLTARAMTAIAKETSETLGLVLLHDRRWSTSISRRTVSSLTGHGAQVLKVPELDELHAREIINQLCPAATVTCAPAHVKTPQQACIEGWKRLAHWRDESFPKKDGVLWPLAIRPGVPLRRDVFVALAGEPALKSPWLLPSEGDVALNGRTARGIAAAQLESLPDAARQVALQLQEGELTPEASETLASLWLLSREPAKAWSPAANAAIAHEGRGDYSRARRLLLLLDTLPVTNRSVEHSRFRVAFVQGRVALRTDVAVRTSLVEYCEHLADSEDERLLARVLRAEYALREGQVRAALVASLRVASAQTHMRTRVRALFVAIQCRLILGQPRDAFRELKRVEQSLSKTGDPLDAVRVLRWKTEIAFASRKLDSTRRLATNTIRRSQGLGYQRGLAYANSRLGTVLRMQGDRRQAETCTRAARDASTRTGDVYLSAETGLALATLLAERGETAGGRHLLDQTVKQIRALRLDHLLPTAMRVALLLAAIQGNTAEAQLAQSTLSDLPKLDPEVPATLVRFWRQQSEVQRALQVEGPTPTNLYGHTLFRIERARAAVSAGEEHLAAEEARAALAQAKQGSFRELEVYAQLIAGAVIPVDDDAWSEILAASARTLNTETYLGALEMDARRSWNAGDTQGSLRQWRSLKARSEELGYRPGMEEAYFWLSEGDSVTYG